MAEKTNLGTFEMDTARLEKSLSTLQDRYFELKKEQESYSNQTKSAKKEIDKLTKSQELLSSAAGDNTEELEANKKEIDKLLKSEKDLFKAQQNVSTQMVTVKKEINQTNTQLKAYQDTEGKTTSLIELGNTALGRQIKNKNDARAANMELNKVANQLNPNIKEEADLLVKLNKQIDDNTDFIKENSSESGKQSLNIGNYKSALDGLSPKMSGYVGQLQKAHTSLVNVKNGLVAQSQATNATTTATNLTSKALKLFKIALVSTGIGAIVVAFGLLITYLTTTQSGIDKITSVTRPLQVVFSSLLGVIQNLGKSLFDAFSNPKKLLTDLADFVKTNLINRFKAFGVILDGIINLDFKKIANGVLQAGSGVEDVIGKVGKAGEQTGKFFDDAIKKGQQIDKLQKDFEKGTLKYNAAQVKVNNALDEQLLLSKDTSLSFAEREKASRKIIEITKANGEEEAKLIQMQIEKLALEQSLNDTKREGNQELIDLEAKLNAAKRKGTQAEIEQLRVIGGARKEANALAKEQRGKELEAQLNQSRAEIDLFVAQQGFKRKSAEEEYKFNKELLKMELADLELNHKNKKLSTTEYEAEKARIKTDYAATNASLLIENAQLEVDAEIKKNQRILDNDKFLSDEQYKLKKQALADNLTEELKFEKLRLEKGQINQEEYNAAINAIDDENRIANQELTNERLSSEQEKKLIDLENQKIINQENFLAQAEIEKQQNEIRRQQEIDNAEKTGASIADIDAKYAEINKQIDAAVNDNKVQLAGDAFGSLSAIFGAESKAGKAAAVAQTTIDTYQSAVSAFKSLSGIPVVGPALGAIAAAAAVKSGIDNVKRITSVKSPEIKKPKYASGVIGIRGVGSGESDDIQANISAGESVINARSTSMFANELAAINQAGGGVGLNGASNILNQNMLQEKADNSQLVSAIAEAVAIGSEIGTSKGSQKGIIGLSDNRKVMSDAKF
jgi:hypothetical protein